MPSVIAAFHPGGPILLPRRLNALTLGHKVQNGSIAT